ncbi:MAG: RNA polymerase [Candidatus Altiarchaeota archaeon]|nr:RNA polymerase [Candidatus Altiarchaeota archaeon]
MIVKEFIYEKPVTLVEVKKILKDLSKEKEELDYVQKKALAHAEKLSKVSLKDAEALQKDLMAKGIEETKSVEIINIMPKTRDELRTLFSKERKQPETEQIDAILEILAKYS